MYWHSRGYTGEGQQWLTELLALPGAAARTTARAKALNCMGQLRRSAGLVVGSQAVGADTHALVAEAISIARETGDKGVLAHALWNLGGWTARVDYATGRALLDESLALWRDLDDQWVGGTFNVLGDVAWEQGDKVAARTWWSEGLHLARQEENQEGIAMQLADLGMMAYHEGDYATARRQIEESLALYRALHYHSLIALTLGCLGAVARAQGDSALARTCYEEKLAFWRRVGDRAGVAATLAELGAVAQQEGDCAQARPLFEEAHTLRRELGHRGDVAASLAHLGSLAYEQGDFGSAAALYVEGLDLLRTIGNRAVAGACLEGLASVAQARGHLERAAQLYGAGATLRRGTFVLHVWDERDARERQIAAVRLVLGDEAFAAAWAEGQGMTLEQAIASALDGWPGRS